MEKMTYLEYEKLYPETIILMKDNLNFYAYNESAKVLNANFKFDVWKNDKGEPTIELKINIIEDICEELQKIHINYIVIIDGIVTENSFGVYNRFNNYINIPIDNLLSDRSMIKKKQEVAFFDDNEKRLNMISIIYIERMLKGIHPVHNTTIDKDSVLNDENVKKCFAFIIDTLKKINDMTSEPKKNSQLRIKYKEFDNVKFLDGYSKIIEKIIVNDEIKISEMTKKIKKHILELFGDYVKVSVIQISDWLLDNNYLERFEDENGKVHRKATENGMKIGMVNRLIENVVKPSYMSYMFSSEAQRFVYEHLEIIAVYKKSNC